MTMQDKKWFFKTSTLIVAFLCVGPLALPLLWWSPYIKRMHKIAWSILVIVLSYCLGILLAASARSLAQYYDQMMEMGLITP